MEEKWDYAELTKAAKEHGGPKELVEKIIQYGESIGIEQGKKKMIPSVIGAFALGIMVTKGTNTVISHIRKRNIKKNKEIEKTKDELAGSMEAMLEEYNDTAIHIECPECDGGMEKIDETIWKCGCCNKEYIVLDETFVGESDSSKESVCNDA